MFTSYLKFLVLVCSLLLLGGTELRAQDASFPVTAVVRTLPPFGPSLSDWADPFNDKLGVTLLLNDRRAAGYQVRLRITIEGQGITLQTRPEFQARPIPLTYGVPVQLSSSELAEYFDLANLNFVGYSQDSYLAQGGLPSGAYSLCVEAIDYDRFAEKAASPKACSFVQAALLDPPVILSPFGAQTAIYPQNLAVQWQARHAASFLTDYTVSIYQINPLDQLSPEQIYALQQPYVFSTVSGLTSLNIDQNFPPLEAGHRYLIRVRAEDPMGSAAFKNDGYSEPMFFSYGSACDPPADFNLTATPNGYDRATIEFITTPGADRHIVRYREDNPAANWYEEEVEFFNSVELTDLNPSTNYVVQVQGICQSGAGAFGPIFSFVTEDRPFDPTAADCGDKISDLPTPTNQNPLQDLKFGDRVQVGQFEMKITSAVSAGGDGWKGAGQIYVGWLGATINCTFNRLYINDERQVYDGVVIANDDGLSSIPGFKSIKEVVAERDTSKLTFCGDSIPSSGGPSKEPPNDLLYGTNTGSYSTTYTPYDPNRPDVQEWSALFYSKWNPKNPTNPYLAGDYSNPANPYTAEKPYKATSIWNPWNGYNSYDPTDYDDPANPWSAEKPWSPEDMFKKQGLAGAAAVPYVFTGGRSLPIAMGEGTNVMAFFGMKFTSVAAYLSAYASFDVPSGDTKKLVAFQATGVGFQPGGLQGEAKMKLMSNVSTTMGDKVKLTLKKGSSTFVAFDCYGINQISVAAQIELCRDVATPLDPYTYEALDDEYVTGDFIFAGSNFDELTGDVSISPFEHPKLPGWAFNVENIVFDMSDKTTPHSVEFPLNYEHPDMDPDYMNGKYSPAWTGVYIGLVRARIPDKLTGRDSTNSVTIQGAGIIIDDTGFTGNFAAINPLSLEEGKIGSWAFAIDSVDIGIQQNQFHHASIAGLIDISALGQPLGYGCHIQPGGYYNFSVRLTDTVSFSAMAAKLELYKNTEIGITYREVDKNFSAYAKLYGSASFSPKLGGNSGDSGQTTASADSKNKLTIPSISFENFHLTTRKPYIESIGTWALSTNSGEQPGMKKFPVKLNSVGMVQNIFDGGETREVAFSIDLTVNLVKSEDKGFGARGYVFIVSDVTIDEEAGTQEWAFKTVKIKRLGINYEGSGFKFNGFIEEFSNKATYGSGFTGGLQASFKPAISVGVTALFGTTQDDNGDDYRYFFADAMVAFNPGITLGPSGLAIYGFGGGISYHMERVGFASLKPPVSPATEAEDDEEEDDDAPLLPPDFFDEDFDPEAEYATADEDIPMPPDVKLPSIIGNSLSGVRYVPNEEVGIGIKATIAFGSIKREVFNGDLTFEIVFNSGGGMRYLGLTGNANFLTPPGPDAKPSVSALVDMGYDFNNDNFSAYLRLSIWAAKGVIRGAYTNGVAGEGNIYASDEEWWIYLGTPQNPFKISIDLSALANVGSKEDKEEEPDPPPPPSAFSDEDLALIGGGGAASGVTEAGGGFEDPAKKDRPPLGSVGDVGVLFRAYLDAGTVLPDFPPPPARVVSILNGDEGNYTYEIIDRNNPVFANAGGLLFGAGFDISMPDLKFLIFYAEFYAGLGFDMMISNLGQTARCANIETDGPIGLNGWYATGQLYAYLEGAIGIDIKLGSFQAKAEILRVAAAVLLQGQMVNPVWMRGKMAGEYSVLNGLVSGRCEFEFEAGTKCEVYDAGEQNIQVMQSITPDTFSRDVDVFVNPQVSFNLPEDRPLIFSDAEEAEEYLLKAKLTSMRLVNDATGVRVPGELSWNSDRTLVAFRPDDILAGNTDYTLTAEAQLLQKIDDIWQPVDGFGSTEANQVLASTFTTGPAPDVIVETNVTYAYPINKQVNFLVDESGQGYVQLDKGQDYLFEGLDRSEWSQVARVVQKGQVKGESPVTYNTTDNRVAFALPSGANMDRETVTTLQIINVPLAPPTEIDANLEVIRRDVAENLMADNADFAENATSIEVREYVASGTLNRPEEQEIYRLTFRTSRHGSFAEKVNDLKAIRPISISHALTEPLPAYDENGNQIGTGPFLGINEFGRNYDSPEPLDLYDLAGDRFLEKDIQPLIRGTARLNATANNWYRDKIAPMLYDRFPQGDFAVDWRPLAELGYPPARAINFGQVNAFPDLPQLNEAQMLSGNYAPLPAQSINAGYHLPYNMYRDYADLWNQVGSYLATYSGTPDPFLPQFLEWQLPRPDYGDYEVRLQYFLPGKDQPNSEVTILLPNVASNTSGK